MTKCVNFYHYWRSVEHNGRLSQHCAVICLSFPLFCLSCWYFSLFITHRFDTSKMPAHCVYIGRVKSNKVLNSDNPQAVCHRPQNRCCTFFSKVIKRTSKFVLPLDILCEAMWQQETRLSQRVHARQLNPTGTSWTRRRSRSTCSYLLITLFMVLNLPVLRHTVWARSQRPSPVSYHRGVVNCVESYRYSTFVITQH